MDYKELKTKPLRSCNSVVRCCLCGGSILRSDRYYDGGGNNKKAHETCVVEHERQEREKEVLQKSDTDTG